MLNPRFTHIMCIYTHYVRYSVGNCAGWSSLPFTPAVVTGGVEPQPAEDEFLKLSLRDKSNTSIR